MWSNKCQVAFEDLKKYLGSPLLLLKLVVGEELYIFLSISPFAITLVLVQDDARAQKLIYYMSKILRETKPQYAKAKKLVYALIISTRWPRPYFQARSIIVLTN